MLKNNRQGQSSRAENGKHFAARVASFLDEIVEETQGRITYKREVGTVRHEKIDFVLYRGELPVAVLSAKASIRERWRLAAWEFLRWRLAWKSVV